MKKFFLRLIVLGVVVLQSSVLFADDIPTNNTSQTSIMQDISTELKLLNVQNIKLPSTPQIIKEKNIYTYEDGSIITETSTITYHNNSMPRSTSGSATKTTEWKKEGRYSSSITASFEWDGKKSTVTSMSSTKGAKSGYTFSTWDESKGDSGLFNKAYAKVDYYGYFTSNPALYNKGKFEIKCSKDGVIE